jgi:hypothetical protein
MPGLESECETERSKAIARWFGIVLLAGLLSWERRHAVTGITDGVFYGIVGGIIAVNLAHTIYLFRARECPAFYKYISVGLDLIFLTVTIRFTGFNQSPFFYVYFVILVSNCIRYGLLMSLYIAVLVNIFYAVTLALAPPEQMQPTVLGGEGLKILVFWGVALYGGAVSARIRRQAFEIAAYEDTIAELRTEMHSLKDQPKPPAENNRDATQ